MENQLFVGLSIQNRIGKSSTTNHAKRRNQVSLTRTQPKNNQSRENFGMQHLENIIMSGGILLKCRGHLLTLHISGLLGIVCFFLFCSCVFDVFFFVFEFWLHLGNAYRKRTRFHRFGQSFYRIAHAHPKATERPRNLKLLPPTPPTPAREKIEETLLEKFKETETICPKS